MPKFRVSIVACARWETDYIAEWLNYHRSIGCSHVYLYCNDDDPGELYAAIMPYLAGASPFVTFIHFPFAGRQRYMYLHFLRTYRHESEWISFIDIDEFVQIISGEPLSRFIDKFDAAWDAVSLNWLFFGPNGFKQRPSGSVLLQYTRRSAEPHVYTKMFTRAAAIPGEWLDSDVLIDFWHHWHDLPTIRTCNVLGESLELYYTDFPDRASLLLSENQLGARLIEIARVAHFAFRSEHDFLRRSERGTLGDFGDQLRWRELYQRGEVERFVEPLNAIEDRSLAEYWSSVLAGAWRYSAIPKPPFDNLAISRPARQSSLSEWSNGADDAAGAVSGHLTGEYQMHTSWEADSWWEVDLGATMVIRQVSIYNCMNRDRRSKAAFQVEGWLANGTCQPFYRGPSFADVGGIDGNPFIWIPTHRTLARTVRLRLLQPGALLLDQVEVYGYDEQHGPDQGRHC